VAARGVPPRWAIMTASESPTTSCDAREMITGQEPGL
jgi:hypothetical protein